MDLILGSGLICGFDPTYRPVAPPLPPPMAYDLPADTPLTVRPSNWPHLAETEHFVIRWGDEGAAPSEAIEGIGRDLEDAWVHQVDTLGWIRPRGTDTDKVDVYLGNTHSSGPTIDFDGAYVTTGIDSIPFVVISPAVVNAYGTRRESSSTMVVAHEFNHTLQLCDDLYGGDRGAFGFQRHCDVTHAGLDQDHLCFIIALGRGSRSRSRRVVLCGERASQKREGGEGSEEPCHSSRVI